MEANNPDCDWRKTFVYGTVECRVQQQLTPISPVLYSMHSVPATNNSTSEYQKDPRGLLSPSFLGLLLTQLLGATNDNILRWLVIGIGKDYFQGGQVSRILARQPSDRHRQRRAGSGQTLGHGKSPRTIDPGRARIDVHADNLFARRIDPRLRERRWIDSRVARTVVGRNRGGRIAGRRRSNRPASFTPVVLPRPVIE